MVDQVPYYAHNYIFVDIEPTLLEQNQGLTDHADWFQIDQNLH